MENQEEKNFRIITETDIDSTDFHVVLKNDLFLSETNLTLNENKIVFAVISQVMKASTILPWFSIKTKDLCKLCSFDEDNIYKILKDIRKNICSKILRMPNQLVRYDNGEEAYKNLELVWLDAFSFNYEKSTWDIHVNPRLEPFILNLKNNFTSERLSSYLKYKTIGGFRLHSFLSVNFDKKTSKFPPEKKEKYVLRLYLSLEDLKKMTDSSGKYPLYGNFKKRVLLPAIKEINKNNFYLLSYEEIKRNKRVDGFYFFARLGEKNERIEKNSKKRLTKNKQNLFPIFIKYFSFSEEDISKIKNMSTDKLIEIISDGKQRLKNGISVESIKNEILTTVDGKYSCSLSEDIERFWDML